LTRAHLLVEHIPGRYTFHDLLRAYAAERANAEDPAVDRSAALHRLLDHYLHSAHAAALALDPHRDPVTLSPAQPGVRPERPADSAAAFGWFTAEHPVLLAAVSQAPVAGFDTHLWKLAWAMGDFLGRRGHWTDSVRLHSAGLAAARRLGDLRGQAYGHRGLGLAYIHLRRFNDAYAEHAQAVARYQALGDDAGCARTYLNLARSSDHLGRTREALRHAERALELYRRAGRPAGEARALNSVGWYHGQLGRYEEGLAFCGRALALLEELGDRYAQAYTLDSLGFAHHHLGDHPAAIAAYQRALELNKDLRDRRFEADTLVDLADAHEAAGQPDAARELLGRAAEIFDELGHAKADTIRARIADPATIR